MSKKLKIPQHKKKELEGFEDLVDGFLEEQEEAAIKNQLADKKDYDSFKSYNFLELERDRVQKLNSMISKKIPNVIEHDISADLIEKFTTYNHQLKNEIITDIKKFDSTFTKNIRLQYNKAFKKNL